MLSTALIVGVLFTTVDSTRADENWPGFLGVGAPALDPQAVPLEWSAESNVAWTADLPGHGQSSPVVWNGRIFLTAVVGAEKDECFVLAFDLKTGQELWRRSIPTSEKVKSTALVSRAAPTPVVDADRVYAFFESGDLLALSHDGDVVWQRSLSKDYGKFANQFGIAASLAHTDGSLFVLADHEGPSWLASIAKSDGKTEWKVERESRVSWSSPSVMTIDGVTQVVMSSGGSIDGYDAASGEKLWSMTDVGGNTVATPLEFADGRFLVGASAGERGQYRESAATSNRAVQVSRMDGKWKAERAWLAEGAMCSFASPMVHQGHAYWLNRQGVVFCFDAKTGETRYAERLAGSCWATPLPVGDRMYFFHRNGATTVLAAGPEFRKLAENKLWDAPPGRGGPGMSGPTLYGVAVSGGSLLVRTGEKLFCVRAAGR